MKDRVITLTVSEAMTEVSVSEDGVDTYDLLNGASAIFNYLKNGGIPVAMLASAMGRILEELEEE